MHAIDITRHHFQPAKHYSGLLHYQGSVLLDSEQNEEALIQQGEGRRVLTDLLVTSGSPDDGMKIGLYPPPPSPPAIPPVPVVYDFSIGAGVFYLGGLRLDVERAEHFKLESEFLQHRALTPPMANDWLTDAQSAYPGAPPVAAQTDLVWLEAWEQAVTGAEDSETLERALQVESSARLRPMRKVHVFPNAATNCASAFQNLVASLEAGNRVSYDPRTAELKSNRRLKVDFVDMGPDPDPCSPPIRRGFLGADNETIQIRVIAPDRFAWSFGNAAPLYRVTRAGNVLTFDSPPRDEFMRPLVGDLIEIIRCDAMLPNGELIGERHGIFHAVATPYDPLHKTVTIVPAANPVDETVDTANATALATDWGLDVPSQYLFARVWRGETMGANPMGKAISPAPGVQLGDTGVVVSFSGDGPVGDSWTFSVRPNTPEIIVPWEMRRPTGAPPTAPRRYITALGLIQWNQPANVAPKFIDCRRHVRKLEDASGCCEVTVGDGTESFGDVATIGEALARLPASGGKICLLRGTHYANVLITDKKNITIEGCGPLTWLRPLPNSTGVPLIAIGDSVGISIRNFSMLAPEEVAIAIDDSGQGDFGQFTKDIDIRAMNIVFRDASAILFNGGEGLKIEQCTLQFMRIGAQPQGQGSNAGLSSSIILLGRDMLVERCWIHRLPGMDPSQLPLGGIQIVGGSERVEIRRNRITDGGGIGIVLGSIHLAKQGDDTQPPRLPPPIAIPWKDYGKPDGDGGSTGIIVIIIDYIISDDGCFLIPVGPQPPIEGDPPVPNADPVIVDCRIIENDIENMGSSGIAPFMQFDLTYDKQLCGVSDLLIRNNRIIGCVRGEAPPLAGGQFIYTARGGIVLGWAENLELVGNHVEQCGTLRFDPICGVFAVGLAHARISGNRIHDNGRRLLGEGSQLLLGQRGGIVIRYVQPAMPVRYGMQSPLHSSLKDVREMQGARMQGGGEALLLHENQVSTPEGRALEVNGVGAMSINDNQLASLGATAASLLWLLLTRGASGSQVGPGFIQMFQLDPFPAIMGNAVVSVLNLGISNDLPNMQVGLGDVLVVKPGGDVATGVTVVTTGRLMFEDNQTRYDGLASPRTLVPCLVGLASLDDAKMVGNQCDADFAPGTSDFAFAHGCVIGVTLQMSANRFSEPTVKVGSLGQLSGLCLGVSVLMHHNFGSHCFLGLPLSVPMSILGPNKSVDLHCDRSKEPGTNRFGEMLGGSYRYAETIRSQPNNLDARYTYMSGRSVDHG
jgi:hypothetical protein